MIEEAPHISLATLEAGSRALTTVLTAEPTLLTTPMVQHWLYAVQTMVRQLEMTRPDLQLTDLWQRMFAALTELLPPPPEVLRLAWDFALPLDTVTRTLGIFAMKGAGKSYSSGVLIEELVKAGQQVTVIDPLGVYWGLRSSANGEQAGLPILIFGGSHGDLHLPPASGKLMARLLLDLRQPVILDLSAMKNKAEQQQFVADFVEGFWPYENILMHIVIDEADLFAPQVPRSPTEQRVLDAVDTLIRRWRFKGVGATLITQRPSVLNKNETDNLEALIVLRIISPRDTKAFNEWFKYSTTEQREAFVATLPSLPNGTAWCWSPEWLKTFRLIKVRQKETFDSSATPKVGARPRTPKQLAEINLPALQERLAVLIEQAQQEDPVLLRARIAQLEQQLANKNGLAEPTRLEKRRSTSTPIADVPLGQILLPPGQTLNAQIQVLEAQIEEKEAKIRTLEEQIHLLAQLKVNFDGLPVSLLELAKTLQLDTMHVAQAIIATDGVGLTSSNKSDQESIRLTNELKQTRKLLYQRSEELRKTKEELAHIEIASLSHDGGDPETATTTTDEKERARLLAELKGTQVLLEQRTKELAGMQEAFALAQRQVQRLEKQVQENSEHATGSRVGQAVTTQAEALPLEQVLSLDERVRWQRTQPLFHSKDPLEREIALTILAYEQKRQELTIAHLALLLDRSEQVIRQHLPDRLIQLTIIRVTERGSSHAKQYLGQLRPYLLKLFELQHSDRLFDEILLILEGKKQKG